MAAVEVSDMIEGIVQDRWWFHFDLSNDVLYFRFVTMRNLRVIGSEDDEEFTIFHTEDGIFAGMTIVCFWERFGMGELDDTSRDEMRAVVEKFACEHLLNRTV